MSINDVKHMPIQERIQLMEALWESLVYDNATTASPEWHKEILVQRTHKIQNENVKTYTIDELKQQR